MPTNTFNEAYGETSMEFEDSFLEQVQDVVYEDCSESVEEKVWKTITDVISEGQTLMEILRLTLLPMSKATDKVLSDSVRQREQVTHKLFVAALEDNIFTGELRNMVLCMLNSGKDAPHFEPLYDALTSAINRQRAKNWIY